MKEDLYFLHKQKIGEIIRQDVALTDIERKYRQTIFGYIGHETTIAGALERLKYAEKILNEYTKKDKLQNRGTTKLGFDIS